MQCSPGGRGIRTRLRNTGFSLALLLVSIQGTLQARAVDVGSPAASLLKVRLETHLTSYTSKPGSPFRAVVVSDYEHDGRIVIPRDSIVYGAVSRVTKVGLGFRHERARLSLKFDEYETPDGQRVPFSAKLISIDNAREKVLRDGQIRGVLAAQNPNGLLNGMWYNPRPDFDFFFLHSAIGLTGVAHQILEILPIGTPGAAALLVLRCAVIRFPEPEIHLLPGTDMNLAVTLPAGSIPSYAIHPAVPVSSSLTEQLTTIPRETTRRSGKPADDIINVIFVGSRQDLADSFEEMGWSKAEQRSARSFSREYSAFASMSGYRTAPVSRLYYRGVLPDLVFQKSLNTVTKRDHIRIWHYGVIEGQDVWLGAATHDSGITFRASAFQFSHRIDGALDVERATVVNDLAFAGCSTPVAFINDTAEVPPSKDGFVTTDGRMAVISLQDCHRPVLAASLTDDEPAPGAPGNKLTRVTRRLVLESRNYFLRENAYYWTYELIRYHRVTTP
jgi:hypothetical protein